MAENRLEVVLSAKTAGIEKSLSQVDARVRATAKGIGSAFVNSAGEVGKLEDALESVSFQEIAAEAKSAAATVQKSFSKAGADVKQAFNSAGGDLPASMAKAKAAVSDFAASAKADLAKVKGAAGDVAHELADIGDAVNDISFANLAEGALNLAEGFRDAANAARDSLAEASDGLLEYQKRVKATFEDTSSQEKVIAAGKAIKEAYQDSFKLEEIGEAATAFKRFGANADETAAGLKRAAAVAKAEGKSISEVAETLGEAFSKDSFDAGIFEELRGQLGVGTDALKKYGAQVDDTGKLLADTKKQQEAAQKSLAAYIDENERYAGAAGRTKTAYGDAKAEVDKFKDSVAEQFNELREGVSKVALPFLKVLNSFPEGFQTAAAGFALITPAVVGFAIGLGKVVTVARLAGVSADGLGKKLAGLKDIDVSKLGDKLGGINGKLKDGAAAAARFATGTGGSVVAIAALAVTLGKLAYEINEYNKSLIDLEKAEQGLLDTQARAMLQNKDRIALQKVAAQTLIDAANAEEDAGKRRVALTDALIAKTNLLEDARRSGDQAAQDAAQREVDLIERARAASDDRVARETKAEKQIQDARKKTLDDSAAWIEEIAAKNAEAAEQRAKDEEAARQKSEADEEAHQKRLQAIRDEALNLRRSALALDREDLSAADQKIQALQGQLEAGKDVTAELEREIKARTENEKKILDAAAALDILTIKQQANRKAAEEPDKGNRQKIYTNAAEAENQVNRKVAQDKAKIDADLAAKQKAAADQRAKAQETAAQKAIEMEAQRGELALETYQQQRQAQDDLFAERRQQIEEEISLGQATAADLTKLDEERAKARKAAIEEETQLYIEAVNKRADAEKAGKSQAEQDLVTARAQLDIEKAKAQAKRDTAAIINQSLTLKKQELAEDLAILQALKDQNAERKKGQQGFKSTIAGGALTPEEAFGKGNTSFGVSRRDLEARDEDGRTQAEVERDIARQRGILNSEQNRTNGRTGNSNAINSGSSFGTPASRNAAAPAAPAGPLSTIPNTAEMGMLAKMDTLIQAVSNLSSTLRSDALVAYNKSWSRGHMRMEGIE